MQPETPIRINEGLAMTAMLRPRSNAFKNKQLILITVGAFALFTTATIGLGQQGGTFTYTVVSQSGQAGISSILGGPSINDAGYCAFAVATNNGDAIFVGNGSAPAVDITPGFTSSTRTFSSYLEINDAGTVAAEDQVSGPSYVLRAWNGYEPGNYQILAVGMSGSFVLDPSINSSGQVAYLHFNGSTYSVVTTNSSGPMFYYQSSLANNVFRSEIADNGSIVGKVGSSTSSGSVRVYSANLGSYTDVAFAGSGQTYSSLDSFPGISRDGQVVAFNGADANGPGIFLVRSGSGGFEGATPVRIAGNNTTGPTSFQTFSKVAVKMSTVFTNEGNVVFVGSYQGNAGLYDLAFQFNADNSLSILGSNLVVSVGQSVTNVTGTVESISLQDPLNTNGDVAFLAGTSSGTEAVIVASPYVEGIDVSSNQGAIFWPVVKNSGVSFAFVRATLGASPNYGGKGTYVDGYLGYNVQQALNNQIVVGVYHLASPTNNPNPVDEALTFLDEAGNFVGDGYLPPMLDLEQAPADYYAKNSGGVAAMSLWVSNWLQFVSNATHVMPGLYTSKEVLANDLNTNWIPNCPLWIANYANNPTATPMYSQGTQSWSWPNWVFQQYTNSGICPGIGHIVDYDSFNGTFSSLCALTSQPGAFNSVRLVSSPTLNPETGQFEAAIFAPGQQMVVIQKSQDLNNWSDLATLPVVNGTATFSDSATAGVSTSFYRVEP